MITMTQSQAKIYLAERQHIAEDATARTVRVLSGENGWFGNLYVANDETLASGCSQIINEEGCLLVLLPIVGALTVSVGEEESRVIACGEVFSVFCEVLKPVSITNTCADALINFLQLRIHAVDGKKSLNRFDIQSNKNKLLTILEREEMKARIGLFGMRNEVEYYMGSLKAGLFCMVIQGSFEIAGRLLHHRDALSIWDTRAVEIESLGPESILFTLELPLYLT